jgi:signal transduction histidine kinase
LLREPHRNAGASLYVFYPEDLLDEAIRAAVRPSLFGLGLGFLAVLFTFGLGQRLVGRIRELDRRTRVIARGDFSPMPVPRPKDELRDLAESVNEMAAQLQQLQETVRRTERLRLVGQLSGGLAHQLRNNVTGAKLAVQVQLTAHPEDTEALGVVLRQLRLMDANLKRFIDLGRDEPRPQSECSIRSILLDGIALLKPQMEHLGITLQESLSEVDFTLLGDAAQLTDLFLNLLTNAIEAAGPGGTVSLRFSISTRECLVEIGDSGPGVSSDMAEKLFEPFVTTKPEGIGLGLAVARRSAEQHGGKLDWYRAERVTVFRVRWRADNGK